MGKAWFCLVLVGFLAVRGTAKPSPPLPSSSATFRAGWLALRDGHPVQAIALLEPALPHLANPSQAALLLFLARCQQGQFAEALEGLCSVREKYRERRFVDSLVAFYTHRLTEAHLGRRARTPQEKSQLAFYLGAYRQDYEGHLQAALSLYQRCLALGQKNTPEYALAQAELARRRPGHTAPYAPSRWQPARIPGSTVRLYRPPDWIADPGEGFLTFLSPDGQAQILVSTWAGGAEVLPSLELTAAQNGTQMERSGRADLRWAGWSGKAWFVEGHPAQREVQQTILALQQHSGFLLFLFESPPSDSLWRRALFDLMLQSLGDSPFGK